jgi:hypothetical protein
MLIFNNYFYKDRKSKLYFGDRVAVLNDFIYQTGGSTSRILRPCMYVMTSLRTSEAVAQQVNTKLG